MAKIFVESYDVWRGLNPSDPAKVKVADGCLTKEVADNIAATYTDLNSRKLIDQATYGGQVFFVTVASKAQLDLMGSAIDAATLRSFLAQQGCAPQIFVRVRDDLGTNSFVQLGVANSLSLAGIVT